SPVPLARDLRVDSAACPLPRPPSPPRGTAVARAHRAYPVPARPSPTTPTRTLCQPSSPPPASAVRRERPVLAHITSPPVWAGAVADSSAQRGARRPTGPGPAPAGLDGPAGAGRPVGCWCWVSTVMVRCGDTRAGRGCVSGGSVTIGSTSISPPRSVEGSGGQAGESPGVGRTGVFACLG